MVEHATVVIPICVPECVGASGANDADKSTADDNLSLKIVGWGTSDLGQRPCYWSQSIGAATPPLGASKELPVLADTVAGAAFAINGDGSVIAGYLFDGTTAHAVRWLRNGIGPAGPFGAPEKIIDLLNSKGIKGPTGWTLRWVTKLSQDGRTMIGDGENLAGSHQRLGGTCAHSLTDPLEVGDAASRLRCAFRPKRI